MILKFKQLEKLFHEIDKQLKTEVNIYVIDGVKQANRRDIQQHILDFKSVDFLFKRHYNYPFF
jgi:hypothetical protein